MATPPAGVGAARPRSLASAARRPRGEPRMPGWFVTFEGGDGSGKSTQLTRVVARLKELGLEAVVTREPGGTPLAERVRDLLLDPERRLDAVTEALLMEA